MAQFERETSYDSSEPTSITNSSTVEGEHTIQNPEEESELEIRRREEEEEEDRTLATTPTGEEDNPPEMEELLAQGGVLGGRGPGEFNADDINLLREKLEEVHVRQLKIFFSPHLLYLTYYLLSVRHITIA